MRKKRPVLAIFLLAAMMAVAGCNGEKNDKETVASLSGEVSDASQTSDSSQTSASTENKDVNKPEETTQSITYPLSVDMNAIPLGVTSADVVTRQDYLKTQPVENVDNKYYLSSFFDETEIVLQGDQITISEDTDAISVSETAQGHTITIHSGGIYVLSGESSLARVVISAKGEKVWLVLNGVTLSYPTGAAIYVEAADKAILVIAKDSTNVLKDVAESSENEDIDAVIYSKDDLIINGSGSLKIEATVNKAIHSKDDLRLHGGVLEITSVKDAVQGNDSIEISAGKYIIHAGGDGLVSKTTNQEDKGYITITGGEVTLEVQKDGIQAATNFTMSDGIVSITSGGGSANGRTHSDNNQGGFWGFGGQQQNQQTTERQKGIKAGNELIIHGGILEADTADDALHSNCIIYVDGGYLELSSGDDGLHADTGLALTGNSAVYVKTSYEGLEAPHIVVAGGYHHIVASDDGLNASGEMSVEENMPAGNEPPENTPDGKPDGDFPGNMNGGFPGNMNGGFQGNMGGFGGSGTQILDIQGGYLYVNADGDGLDSNGSIYISGGITLVAGPTSSANGALDSGDGSDNGISITNGILVAVGSVGMMEVPEENYAASANLGASKGTLVTVTDQEGNVLVSWKLPKQAMGIVVSCNGKADGYKIYKDGEVTGTYNADGVALNGSISGGSEVELSTNGSWGGFGGMGGHGGGHGGSNGNRPGKN